MEGLASVEPWLALLALDLFSSAGHVFSSSFVTPNIYASVQHIDCGVQLEPFCTHFIVTEHDLIGLQLLGMACCQAIHLIWFELQRPLASWAVKPHSVSSPKYSVILHKIA